MSTEPRLDRREFLARTAATGLALPGALRAGGGALHHAPKVQRVVHVCLCGGLSHLDSFDHKPALARYHGKSMPVAERPDVFFLLRRGRTRVRSARYMFHYGSGDLGLHPRWQTRL